MERWRRERDVIHHRRFASGVRTCNLDGENPSADSDPIENDTPDPKKVTCPMCVDDLHARRLL